MAENKKRTDSLVNGCPAESENDNDNENVNVNVVELSDDVVVGAKAGDSNSAKVAETTTQAPQTFTKLECADKKSEDKSNRDSSPSPVLEEKKDIAKEDATVNEITKTNTTATTSGLKSEVETGIEKISAKLKVENIGDKLPDETCLPKNIVQSKSEVKEIAETLATEVEETPDEIPKKNTSSEGTESPVSNRKKNLDEVPDGKGSDEESPVIGEIIPEEKDKAIEIDRSRRNLTSDTRETTTNHRKNDINVVQVDEEDEEDDEEVMETEEPEEVEEDDEGEEEDDDDDEDENDNEQLELGIVGPPTAVSELINEEELRCSESVLLTDGRGGVENVQDHVAEWVQNSANNKVEELTIDEDENENENDHDRDRDRDDIEGSRTLPGDKKTQKNNENVDKNVEVLATRKSKRVVSNIIKRSIKCLNKMHAMDASSGIVKGQEKVTITSGATKKTDSNKVLEGEENTKSKECRSGNSPASLPATRNQNRERRNQNHHQNHLNHNRNGNRDPMETGSRTYDVKKEPNSEPETDPEPERDALPELRKRSGSDRNKKLKSERERDTAEQDCKKRRSTDEMQNSNGKSKRACLEQREEFLSSIVGGEKVTTEELTVRAEQLRAELQALDQLARAKEKEWNEILSMRKLKEEAYLRIERRRQVVGFMEGNGQLNETSVVPSVSLSLEPEWDNAKEKSNSTEATSSDKSTRPQVTSKQSENGQKESSDGQNSETRQIGEGRQGPMVDVRTIIADYRLRHPETVPRRSRRMRNSVNVGLGAGGAMVENTHVGADSRPSSTDSCKSSSNATDPSNSMSFKDVLVQFAKLSQQQGEAVKTPQNYPDVTLHPVLPSPAAPQTAAIQQSGSLLHGILTKSQSPRPTTFSPTLARLLTAPERERCNPMATSTPQQTTATQHLLQAYQGTNPVSISDLLSSSKARTEITITPVVSTPIPQSHSNSLIHVEDVEEETTVIEERGRSSNARDDSPPRCQGCQDRAAQFVCAGCGNQWYCSRECQVSAWDEHSEVCSG